MAIYLGTTEIGTLYLGAAGYATPNVDAVYLGSTLVWGTTPAVTFTQGTDAVCSSLPSYIGVAYSFAADFELSVSFSISDGSTAIVDWQGSYDGQNWQAISGFPGYAGTSGSGQLLFMDRISPISGYRIRAVVNGTPSTIHSAVEGGYVDFPPCEP